MTPAIANEFPLVAATPPPEAPSAMPRLALRDTTLVVPSSNKTPPFNVNALLVAVIGTVPRLSSAEITSVPPLICVIPVNVLTPASS